MMNTEKLKDALLELQSQRNVLDAAIAEIQKVLAMLSNSDVEPLPKSKRKKKRKQRNYVSDAILVLESTGHPLNLDELTTKIGELRGLGNAVPRGSLESSLTRHLSHVKPSLVIRVKPGIYGLPAWNATLPFIGTQAVA